MLAIVLSGAANYGSMQVGALQVLLESGLHPELVVGSSAGALNAIQLANNPTPEGIDHLQEIWEAIGPKQVGKFSLLAGLHRVITRQDGLFHNAPLARFYQQYMPEHVDTFGQLEALYGVKAYAIAVCMETGRLTAFGDNPKDRLVDGAMASTALPPYFPPWRVDGHRFVDGGVVAKLPIAAAIERGATQVIALNVVHTMDSLQSASNLVGISAYAISLMADHHTKTQLACAKYIGVPVRLINMKAPTEVPFWDYNQASYLFHLGREIASHSLEDEPLIVYPSWRVRIRGRMVRAVNHFLSLS